MKIDISNTTRKLENLTHINSNLEHYKANIISPKKSKKVYRTNNTSKFKRQTPDDVSRQINFDDINVNEFNEKFEKNNNNNNNKEISLNAKEENQNNNENNYINFQNKSFNLLNSKVNYEKELHNSSNIESIRKLNNSSFKEKAKENKFITAQLTKRQNNEASKIRENNLKKKLDENLVFKKSENEKIIQNNCQNIYNVNINPIGIYYIFYF